MKPGKMSIGNFRTIVSCVAGAIACCQMANAQKAYFPMMIDQPMEYPIRFAVCHADKEAPVMDGRLDDACWKDIRPLGDFQLTDARLENHRWIHAPPRLARHQTRVKVMEADGILYLAAECIEPEMDKVRAEAVYHDEERICFDDRIEVFIDPKHDHKNVFQFVVNARGATLERPISRPVPYAMSHVLGDIGWNTEWFARVRRLEDRWTAEIAISIERLLQGPVRAGDTIGFNVCRDRQSIWRFGPSGQKFAYPQECSAWAYSFNYHSGSMTVGKWIEPIMFGDLVFGAGAIEVTKLAFYQSTADYNGAGWHRPQLWGDNRLQVALRNSGNDSRTVRLEATAGGAGETLKRTTDAVLPAGGERAVGADIPVRGHDDQPFSLTIRDTVSGERLYETSYATRVPPFVEFDLSAIYAPAAKAPGGILFAPLAMPESLHGLTLQMVLRAATDQKALASRKVTGPDASANFAEAFPGFAPASIQPGNYEVACDLMDDGGKAVGSFTQRFTKPLAKGGQKFGAREGQYQFAGETGRAVIVSFSQAHDYVFWERASYTPWWDVSGVGVCYEFVESWGYGNMGCSEPMQDKENRFSRVCIVENSPARAVVHWRYALSDPNYRIFRDEWVDEYYYLYPDAVGGRQVNLWANSDLTHEFIQPQYVLSPGILPEQVFERRPCRVFNLAGDAVEDDLDIPGNRKPTKLDCDKWAEGTMRIRLKDRSHPFYSWVRRDDTFPRIERLFPPWQPPTGDIRYNLGGHYPITQLNVDVYNIFSTHRAYHTWAGMIQAKADPDNVPNSWVHLIGVTDRDDSFLREVTASWAYPATMIVEAPGWRDAGYDFKQRAFLLEKEGAAESGPCRVRLESARSANIFNPVFVLKGAPGPVSELRCNGSALDASDFRSAPSWRTGETILWLGRSQAAGVDIEIGFAASAARRTP